MFAVASGAVLVAADGFNESQFIVDQRVSATGTAQWDSAGVELASSPIVDDVHFAADGTGGAFVAWEEGDNGLTSASTWNIRVFRQGPDGAPASSWSTAIFPSDTSGSQTMPRIVEDGTGGILLAWRQWPIGARFSHVFAHHLDASGNSAPGWPSTGIAVAPTDSGQGTPAMISDGSGGLIVAFADGRNQAVSGSDIYAQRLLGNGAVASVDHHPATATGFRVDPNPTSGALRLSFALSRAGPVAVELFDIGGKRIGLRELGWLSAGPHAIRWDTPTSQAPGIYWLRLHRDGLANSQRIAILR